MSHFNVSFIVWTKSRVSVRKPQFLKRTESRSGSNRGPCAYQPSGVITSLTFFVKAEAEPRPCLSYDILHNDDHVYGPAAGSLAHRPDRHSVGPGSNPGWRSGRGRIFPLESTSITIYRTPKRTPRRHALNSGRHGQQQPKKKKIFPGFFCFGSADCKRVSACMTALLGKSICVTPAPCSGAA